MTTAKAANSRCTQPANQRGSSLRSDAAEEQRRGHVGGRDPEDRRLQMPGAHQVAREDPLQLEAVEAAGIGAVVRHRAADQRLHQEQQRHDHEELHQRALARAGLTRHEMRVDVWPRLIQPR